MLSSAPVIASARSVISRAVTGLVAHALPPGCAGPRLPPSRRWRRSESHHLHAYRSPPGAALRHNVTSAFTPKLRWARPSARLHRCFIRPVQHRAGQGRAERSRQRFAEIR